MRAFKFFSILCFLFVGFIAFSVKNILVAETRYFDFTLSEQYLNDAGVLEVRFDYLLDGFTEEDFKVKPGVDRGLVSIFDEKTDAWVSEYSLWTGFPSLKPYMKIKITGFQRQKTDLKFIVQNIKNGEKYETPKKKVWVRKPGEKYIERLNKNIRSDKEAVLGASNTFETTSSETVSNTKSVKTLGVALNQNEKDKSKNPSFYFTAGGLVGLVSAFIFVAVIKYINGRFRKNCRSN